MTIMAMIANEFGKGVASTIVVNKSADSSMNKGLFTSNTKRVGHAPGVL